MASDIIQNRISFYEKVNDGRDHIMKSEIQRLQLEKAFHKNVNSEKKQIKEKALKLQAYYKKLCDDERNSTLRNQQILSDLSRVDQQFQLFEAKLERLATLKKECEKHIQNNFSGWNDMKNNLMNNNNPSNSGLLAMSQNNNNNQYSIQSGLQNYGEFQNNIGSYLSNTNSNDNTQKSGGVSIQEQMRQQFLFKPDVDYYNQQQQQQPQENKFGINNLVNKNINMKNNEQNSVRFKLDNGLENQLMNIKSNFLNQNDNFISEALIKSNPLLNSSPSKPPLNVNTSNDNIIKEYEREIALQDGTYNQQATGSMPGVDELFKSAPNRNQPTWTHTPIIRNFDDFDSPQSPVHQNNKSETSDNTEEFSKRRNSLRQELNVAGLFKLLEVIESDMNHTIHPQKYYRQDQPPYKSRLDIIKWARSNNSSDDMDAGNVSMVVLDQLRIVVRKQTKNACLFTREILSYSVADINEKLVEKHLSEAKDKELWKRLLKHFCLLKRFCSMDSAILANLFAPSLIAQDGFGSQKAIQFLEKIINSSANSIYDFDKSEGKTESSFYDDINLKDSKLKETKSYQNFIMSNNANNKKQSRISDEDDEIEKFVIPKGTASTGSLSNSNLMPSMPPAITSKHFKSPRDGDFDFSQSSSDLKQDPGMIVYVNKSLNSSKSSKDKKPIYMRNLDDSDFDDSSESDNQKTIPSYSEKKGINKNKISDPSLEFYQ